VLRKIEADLKKIAAQMSAGKGSNSTADAIEKLSGELTDILNSLKNSGSTPTSSITDLLNKILDDVKALVSAFQNGTNGSGGSAGNTNGAGGSAGAGNGTSGGGSSTSNGTAGGSGGLSSTGNSSGKPDYIDQTTWDNLGPQGQAQIKAQSAQEDRNNAMNMAMYSLQQSAQQDARILEALSQLSRTSADAAMNTVRNIRA
jgi:hypothetical protein